MKIYDTHARRGKDFEVEINAMCDMINMAGGFAMKLQPEKVGIGQALKVIRGEPFDYMIILPNEIHCFDAKTTESDAWPITGILDEEKHNAIHRQAFNMLKVGAILGDMCKCYFAVWFKSILPSPEHYPLIRFEAEDVVFAARQGVKALRPSDGIPWHFNDILRKCPGFEMFAKQKYYNAQKRSWLWRPVTYDMFKTVNIGPVNPTEQAEEE